MTLIIGVLFLSAAMLGIGALGAILFGGLE